MKYNSLGVIGGMGPMATSVFFDKVIKGTDANKDQDHIDMIILNHATLPDRTSAILENKEEAFLEQVRKDIKLLEIAGVSNIAIPCNTSHYFYDKMQEMTDIHIINMVEETVKEIYNTYGEHSKVGILATKGTISSGIYDKACKKYNIQLIVPTEGLQEQIMKIIYSNIKGDLCIDVNEIETIIKNFYFQENCNCTILACTELSCIELSEDVKKYSVDAMNILVRKSIELSGKRIKDKR